MAGKEKLTHEVRCQCPFCNRAIIILEFRTQVRESVAAVYEDRTEVKRDPQQVLSLRDKKPTKKTTKKTKPKAGPK